MKKGMVFLFIICIHNIFRAIFQRSLDHVECRKRNLLRGPVRSIVGALSSSAGAAYCPSSGSLSTHAHGGHLLYSSYYRQYCRPTSVSCIFFILNFFIIIVRTVPCALSLLFSFSKG